MVESRAKLTGKRWHRQRAHFVVASMRRFADELRGRGLRRRLPPRRLVARADYADHVAEFAPTDVLATEPASWDGLALLRVARRHARSLEPVPLPPRRVRRVGERAQAAQDGGLLPLAASPPRLPDGRRRAGRRAAGTSTPTTASRHRRTADRGPSHRCRRARRPRPRGARRPAPRPLGRRARRHLGDVARARRWRRLDHFVDEVLPLFGPHEDAMLAASVAPRPHAAVAVPEHRAAAARRGVRRGRGRVPTRARADRVAPRASSARSSAGASTCGASTGCGCPTTATHNALGADRPLPPVFTGAATTEMRCVRHAVDAARPRLGAPHPAADGARQPGAARRRRPVGR